VPLVPPGPAGPAGLVDEIIAVGVTCNEALLASMVGVLVISQLEAPSEARAYD